MAKKYTIKKEVGARGTFWYAYNNLGCLLETGTSDGVDRCEELLRHSITKTATVVKELEI